ncbi:hypothetical protein RF11_00848 [Thelohanellus kitauei]|uniref:Uncharacterized protein n=1 Tax=Thelohanellus kitauei TaxID=669202 RepID=A0A0C2N8H0_THEKT|nr:hypothetical protein RF11_00848 [Thelohanellus kitauei]
MSLDSAYRILHTMLPNTIEWSRSFLTTLGGFPQTLILIDEVVPTTDTEKRRIRITEIAVTREACISEVRPGKIRRYLPLADNLRQAWGFTEVSVIPIVFGHLDRLDVAIQDMTTPNIAQRPSLTGLQRYIATSLAPELRPERPSL